MSLASINLYCQQESLTVEEQFAQLEAEMDSLSIFLLFDSILNSSDNFKYSELNIRASYNSNVLSAGRNFERYDSLNLGSTNITPGISFYHQSGLFVDYSGFWNPGYETSYNLSVFSVGYMRSLSKTRNHWAISSSYERWWYHGGQSNALNNTLSNTLSYSRKFGYASLDYSFLFGQDYAHRVIGTVSGTIDFGKWWKFKSIKILPSFSAIFGNSDITVRFSDQTQQNFNIYEAIRSGLQDEQTRQQYQMELTATEQQQIEKIQNDRDLRYREKLRRISYVYFQNDGVYNLVLNDLTEEATVYGFMNYSFSLPIVFSTARLTTMLSYSYSIPVELPGELDFPNVGYFGASVIYRIPFKN